ncbi:MAG: cytochrome c maturation protein CcmE [Deltaproteobacteria bacterium]|jgi:cytochrome c-type biogenesis protein CcmE|nr:cytochrome c maturation protein CcmE [Deltaproteobacteria bacterium]
MARKSQKSLYIAALALFLSGVAYLMYSGFSENSMYFLNVSEALAAPQEKLTAARLFGTVAERDLAPLDGSPGVRFRLEDKNDKAQTIVVRYRGAVPDAFKPGAEVIVEGAMELGGAFNAKTLMTKCPSKYQKENRS